MNINTEFFWDKEFKKEFEVWRSQTQGFVRFNWPRFEEIDMVMPKQGTVLDIGCGLGHFLRYVHAKRPLQYTTTGVDFSHYAIEQAQKYDDKSTYVYGTAYDLPFPDESFDCVVAQEIIEHLDDVLQFLAEIRRVAKPNAIIIVTTPERQEGQLLSHEHVREFSLDEFISIMSAVADFGVMTRPFGLTNPNDQSTIFDYSMIYAGVRK